MKRELDEKLVNTFPLLYADRHSSMQSTSMCWGFSCGDGWFDIIWQLSSKLEPLIQKIIKENPNLPHPRAAQVKEKFGGLRFYMTSASDEIYRLIDEAEELSYRTCESCGAPAEIDDSNYWIKTICEACKSSTSK